jgi:hypothetical protein
MSKAQQMWTVGGKQRQIMYDAFVAWDWVLTWITGAEDGSSFQNVVLLFLEYRTTDNVQIPSNPECYTPSS